MKIKDWQALFDGKTTKHWKTEGQVSVEDGILKIGGDKGGSIVTSASFARGFARFSSRQAGEAKATMTWRGEEHALRPARQGWTSEEYEPDAAGESPIRIVAPPGTTLLIQEIAFRPYENSVAADAPPSWSRGSGTIPAQVFHSCSFPNLR